ncbi:MAG: N,N-dimethylformamidase beta subunit family domain-containing protein, partial [Thermomicrobiales bacterium]
MTVMGYANRLSARPGETIEFKVSCDAPSYEASLVRFRGSLWPKHPIQPETIEAAFTGEWPGRPQPVPIGSWITLSLEPELDLSPGVVLGCHIAPSMPGSGKEQAIASFLGDDGHPLLLLAIDDSGHLTWSAGGSSAARSASPLIAGRWYRIVASAGDSLSLTCTMAPRSWLPAQQIACEDSTPVAVPGRVKTILLAARTTDVAGCPQHCYNGKIARPVIARGGQEVAVSSVLDAGLPDDQNALLAAWDFSIGHHTDRVAEITGRHADGVCHNQPMRAVVGPHWTGREVNPKLVPHEYDAIAFHEDDLADCRWQTDFRWTVPDSLEPGVYGARIQAGDEVDHIPFYARTSRTAEKPPVLFHAPTYTYLAYGNERLYGGIESTPDFIERAVQDPIVLTERDHFLMEH